MLNENANAVPARNVVSAVPVQSAANAANAVPVPSVAKSLLLSKTAVLR